MAPDSYKGTLTAAQVCEIMRRAILTKLPEAVIDAIPMADGGEGTIEAIVASSNGKVIELDATGPLGAPVRSRYGAIQYEGERCAVLEAASLFGLPMVEQEKRNPLRTTSRGLGDAIRAALDLGFRRFIIGLGGSATNDGGIGLLAALGVRFYNGGGEELYGFGEDLSELERIDWTGLDERIGSCAFTIASDVDNPLLGRQGATYVYGPQKGATAAMLERLEAAMSAYADVMKKTTGIDLGGTPGAGAAGGLGFALLHLGGRIVPGARVVEETSGLKARIERADWVVTGEGCSDGQTLRGKAPFHIARLAEAAGKPALLVSGSLGRGWEQLLPHYAGCFSTVTYPAGLDEVLRDAEQNLYTAVRNAASLIGRL
ncbi:glycerate kinase [Cohnella cellulosilytica]|uniref:glycerate kinase family protein n=1 Tax=Cohnella cellulosilytica TaxID=986710 RepID=UPI0035EC437A